MITGVIADHMAFGEHPLNIRRSGLCCPTSGRKKDCFGTVPGEDIQNPRHDSARAIRIVKGKDELFLHPVLVPVVEAVAAVEVEAL